MSEPERLRRLHVENRLAELRGKHGRDAEDQPLPAWLDTYEGLLATLAQEASERAQEAHPAEEVAVESSAPEPPPRPARRAPRREVWDR